MWVHSFKHILQIELFYHEAVDVGINACWMSTRVTQGGSNGPVNHNVLSFDTKVTSVALFLFHFQMMNYHFGLLTCGSESK